MWAQVKQARPEAHSAPTGGTSVPVKYSQTQAGTPRDTQDMAGSGSTARPSPPCHLEGSDTHIMNI